MVCKILRGLNKKLEWIICCVVNQEFSIWLKLVAELVLQNLTKEKKKVKSKTKDVDTI